MEIVSDIKKQPVTAININERFRDQGFDFVRSDALISNINKSLGTDLKSIDLFSYPDIDRLTHHISQRFPSALRISQPSDMDRQITHEVVPDAAASNNPNLILPDKYSGVQTTSKTDHYEETVAIIGMSGQFGSASNIDAFWGALISGTSLIEEVSDERWRKADHYSTDKNEPDKTYSKWGSFIRDIDKFDPLFFKISGREAEAMDPQQRLFLEQCWKALEDAAINPDDLKSTRCGVFAGVGTSDYLDKTVAREATSFWGNYSSVLPARISYFLDLKGPAISIDTACSSSLVALDLACKSLLSGESDLVLTGGVWIGITPDFHKQASRARMLSPNGTCYAFDSRANGFVPGEAVGVIVLKRLSDAERDGDPIYGIVRGSLTNQDGATNGITAPSALSQQILQEEVYKKNGIDPETIGYVEAHGTGTRLGDPIEFEALNASFGAFSDQKNYCGLGSVKTNIGHTVMAAGISGVIKVLLSLKHRQLPPSLNYQNVNPMIDIANSPFRIITQPEPWIAKDNHPRRGTVSSYGFSGTNAHVVLEEYVPGVKDSYTGAGPAIILLSARDTERLKDRVNDLIRHIDQHPDLDLYDMAYTLQIGRSPMKERLAIVADSLAKLKENLTAYANGQLKGLIYGDSTAEKIDFLLDSEEGKAYITSALKEKEFFILARFWVKGLAIDWNSLYPDIKPRKLNLPVYSFARELYWLSDSEEAVVMEQGKKLHPLVHVNNSMLSEQVFNSTFSGKEFFLQDHVVATAPILPGVAYLEMARAAGKFSTGKEITQLKNISWISPLQFDGQSDQISIRIRQSEHELGYEISTLKNGTDQLHNKGIIRTQPLTPLPAVNIDSIRNRFTMGKDKAACYDSFQAIGLNYGPTFQGITQLYYNENEALAAIELPIKKDFLLHPGLLDSAIQTCMGIMHAKGSPVLAVPYHAAAVNIYTYLPEKIWSYARKSDRHTAQRMCFDIDLLAADGTVVLQFKELVFLPFIKKLDSKDVPAASDLHLFSSLWKTSPADSNVQTITHGTSSILLADGSERLAEELKKVLNKDVEAVTGRSEAEFFSAVLAKIQAHITDKIPAYITIVIQQDDYLNYGFVSGLLKTATLENPMIYGRVVYVESLSIKHLDELTRVLRNEQDRRETEVRYLNGIRQIRTIQKESIAPEQTEGPLVKEGGVYLITGGVGGLGKIFAQYISQTRIAHIIVTGRSPFNEKIRAAIDGIPNCSYIPCNVCNQEAVLQLIRQIKKEHQYINGIIHSAGVLQDGLIVKGRVEETFREVLSPKIEGTRNLDIATKDEPIDFMVFFSSIVSVTGNAGQAAYTAANAYMDHYATYRNEAQEKGFRYGKTVSINWPLWQAGGMNMPEEQQRLLKREFGLTGMPTDMGITAFEQALRSDHTQVIVACGDSRKISESLTVRQLIHPLTSKATVATQHNTVKDRVQHQIQNIAATILKFDRKSVRADKDLMDYGFDSNMLTGFINQLNDCYQLSLPPTLFYNYPTIAGLVTFLLENHADEIQKNHEHITLSPTNVNNEAIILPAYDQYQQAVVPGPQNQQEAFIHSAQDIIRHTANKISDIVAAILRFDKKTISNDKDLMDYGFDSNMLTGFANELNDYYDIKLAPTIFYNYPSISSLVTFLKESHLTELQKKYEIETHASQFKTGASVEDVLNPLPESEDIFPAPAKANQSAGIRDYADENSRPEPIAIIGISGRFPGSESLSEFWEQVRDNKDMITEIPPDRWDWQAYYGDPHKDLHKTKAKWGGFINDIDKFDAPFFEISPMEAELMDPQQRITLEAVYTALEDAGIPSTKLKGTDTGVFIGILNSDYTQLINVEKELTIQAQISSGNLRPILTNRISYLLDIHGPSQPIDTACSSSLVAIHKAVSCIRSGECRIAIAGGVNALLSAENTVSISNAGMLSEDGRCKTFDQSANGYVRAEGVGMVILKKLSHATADGDHIYGLILGTAENHGGKANTLTSPNPQAQKNLLLSAYRAAGIDPASITYIEAHGTGTPIGDPIETEGLKMAFATLFKERGQTPPEQPYCGLGSVKANIGHLESAAGMAGIMKVLFAMKHQTLPGNPQLFNPNEYLRLSGSPFHLRQETSVWQTADDTPRRAGVSSFGFGGSNAHIILEEYCPPVPPKYKDHAPALIVLSAKNTARLKDRVKDLINYITAHPATDIYDIAYTLQTGRDQLPQRLAILVSDVDELKQKLERYLNDAMLATSGHSPIKGTSDVLPDEEETKTRLSISIKERDLSGIINLWLAGVTIDWSLLYPTSHPARISLPTYPFERKRYWIKSAATVINKTAAQQLHPLVHSNTSNLTCQKYTSLFTGAENFLQDHKAGTDFLLPGVAYLEMARHAGTLSLLEPVSQIRNVSWLSPLRVNGTPVPTDISIRSTGKQIIYEVTTQLQNTEQLHSTGTIVTGTINAPAALNIQAIRKRFTTSKGKEACYQLFRTMGLDYGPSFRGIEQLYYQPGEALSLIALPKQPGFILTPGLLDSALQTCIGTLLTNGQPSLLVPFSVKEVNIYRDLPERIWSYAKQRNTTGLLYDIDIVDASGQLLVDIRGLTLLPFSGEARNITAGDEYDGISATRIYNYQWASTALMAGKPAADNTATTVVLLGQELSELTDRLSEVLKVPVIALTTQDKEICFNKLLNIVKEQPWRSAGNLFVIYLNDQYARYGFLSGLLKTAHAEYPSLIPRLIGIDHSSVQDFDKLVNILQAEQFQISAETEIDVRYKNGNREAKQLSRVAPTVPADSFPLTKEGGVYLIIGGVGGLGQLFSDLLIETRDIHVIIAGRKVTTGQWELFGKPGPGIRYYQCDISDPLATNQLVRDIITQYGKLNGIIHSAGVIRDSLIFNKTADDVRQVFAPKITGTENIDNATKDTDLDFMAFFSSTAAITGNAGQADYAAANAFLDNYASYRNELVQRGERKGHTISINWPLWANGGMHVTATGIANLERKWGMIPMPAPEGMKAFTTILKSAVSQQVVIYGNSETPFSGAPASLKSPNSILHNNQQEDRLKNLATDNLRSLVAELLNYHPDEILADTELGNYGFNSFMLMRFANQINEYYDLDLAPNAFYHYPTVDSLADFLLESHREQLIRIHPVSREEAVVSVNQSTTALTAASPGKPEHFIPGIAAESRFRETATRELRRLVAKMLSYEEGDLQPDVELGKYGLNSFMLVQLANHINEYYDLDLAPNTFYHYSTINSLITFLIDNHKEALLKKHTTATDEVITLGTGNINGLYDQPDRHPDSASRPIQEVPSRSQPVTAPIAIVGMSGRFPGTDNLTDFWEKIRDNKDLISEVPADRWDWQAYYGDPRKDFRKTKAKWGGFIADMDKFDPLFFDISPREAELMDPQQRITLEAVHTALEDAAIPPSTLKGSNTGVFIGVLSNEYSILLYKEKDLAFQAQTGTGNAPSILVNRISYLMDLRGPSEPVNTACSSSLVAIHRAVEAIRSGRCHTAIAGGVNALLAPEVTISLSNAGMLSEDGRCKPFDQAANGYVRAEGVGIIVLKSLDQAEQDVDHIYGIIRGISENHGGKANTLTSPNPAAQQELLLQAYRSAGIDPRTITYIEAHGTGTPLGDPTETEGIKLALAALYKEHGLVMSGEPYCGIGSVKANIGHLESAAGMAGIIKVLLSMKHKTLPGNPQLNKPNEYLRLQDTPLYLQQETSHWKVPDGMPRIAGVSSFGFGGTNAHIVLEEYLPMPKEKYPGNGPALILLSAKNKERLKERAGNLLAYLERYPDLNFYDIAYTLQIGRDAMEERIAFTVNGLAGLKDKLREYVEGTDALHKGNSTTGKEMLKIMSRILGPKMMEELIQKGAYDQLSELWCAGATVDWQLLYPAQTPERISLPGYPFARERYWIPEPELPLSPLSVSATSLPVINDSSELKWLQDQLLSIAAYTLKRSEADLNPETEFFNYGFDSILGAALIKNINEVLQVTLTYPVLFDHTNIVALATYIQHQHSGTQTISNIQSVTAKEPSL